MTRPLAGLHADVMRALSGLHAIVLTDLTSLGAHSLRGRLVEILEIADESALIRTFGTIFEIRDEAPMIEIDEELWVPLSTLWMQPPAPFVQVALLAQKIRRWIDVDEDYSDENAPATNSAGVSPTS